MEKYYLQLRVCHHTPRLISACSPKLPGADGPNPQLSTGAKVSFVMPHWQVKNILNKVWHYSRVVHDVIFTLFLPRRRWN